MKSGRGKARFLMAVGALMLGLGTTGWWFAQEIKADLSKRLAEIAGEQSAADVSRAYAELAQVRSEKRDADTKVLALGKTLEAERARRLALESDAAKTTQALAEMQKARATAETAANSLRDELKRDQAVAAATETKRISEDKPVLKGAAPESAAVKSSEAQASSPQASAEAKTPSGHEIETSAVQAAKDGGDAAPVTSEPSKADQADGDAKRVEKSDRVASSQASAPTRLKAKKTKAQGRRLPPTYMVEQHDVPWPYNTWYP